jgi:hypothetical protein
LAYSIVKVLALLTNSVAQFVLKFINRMNLHFHHDFGQTYSIGIRVTNPRSGLGPMGATSFALGEALSTVIEGKRVAWGLGGVEPNARLDD